MTINPQLVSKCLADMKTLQHSCWTQWRGSFQQMYYIRMSHLVLIRSFALIELHTQIDFAPIALNNMVYISLFWEISLTFVISLLLQPYTGNEYGNS